MNKETLLMEIREVLKGYQNAAVSDRHRSRRREDRAI